MVTSIQQKNPVATSFALFSSHCSLILNHIAKNSRTLKLAEDGIEALRAKILIVTKAEIPNEEGISYILNYRDGGNSRFFVLKEGASDVKEYDRKQIEKVTAHGYFVASSEPDDALAITHNLSLRLMAAKNRPAAGSPSKNITIEDAFNQKSITLFTAQVQA